MWQAFVLIQKAGHIDDTRLFDLKLSLINKKLMLINWY